MSVTEDTFQPPIGWLNAPENILYMFVTADTSQPPMAGRTPPRS